MPRFARNACGQLMADQGMGWIPAPRALGIAPITFVPPSALSPFRPAFQQEVVEQPYTPPQVSAIYTAGEGDVVSDYDQTGFICNAGTKKVPISGIYACTKGITTVHIPGGDYEKAIYTCVCNPRKVSSMPEPFHADPNSGLYDPFA